MTTLLILIFGQLIIVNYALYLIYTEIKKGPTVKVKDLPRKPNPRQS